jgi:hypothetical protein
MNCVDNNPVKNREFANSVSPLQDLNWEENVVGISWGFDEDLNKVVGIQVKDGADLGAIEAKANAIDSSYRVDFFGDCD